MVSPRVPPPPAGPPAGPPFSPCSSSGATFLFCVPSRFIFAALASKMVLFQKSRIGVALSRPSAQKHGSAVASIDVGAGARAAGYSHARLHDLRHSTASEIINAGVDLYTAGGVLGHKSAVSTKRYSHLATKTLKSAVALVGKKTRTTAKKKAA